MAVAMDDNRILALLELQRRIVTLRLENEQLKKEIQEIKASLAKKGHDH